MVGNTLWILYVNIVSLRKEVFLYLEIDATYSNFTGRLYVLHPRLSETELQISLLIKAEIPLKEIARLLCKEKSTISNIRKRLYEKTHGETGKAEQWDEFILSL